MNNRELANFIWSLADLLRGDYKQTEYGKVILPFTILRRLDCVLEKTKEKVLEKFKSVEKLNEDAMETENKGDRCLAYTVATKIIRRWVSGLHGLLPK